MMRDAGKSTGGMSFIGLLVFTVGLVWLALRLGLPVHGSEIRSGVALVWFVAIAASFQFLMRFVASLAAAVNWMAVRTATGKEGTAHFAKSLRKFVNRCKTGFFWGMQNGKGLWISHSTNSFTAAPSGSRKTTSVIAPMCFSIFKSKWVPDFKLEVGCIVKKALEERGEENFFLNSSGRYEEILGPSACYNPVDVISDNLWRSGGLRDVPEDIREITMKIYPEPENTKSNDDYFRQGGRDAIGLTTKIECCVEGYDASLPGVARVLADRQRLEDTLRWIAGLDLDGQPAPEGPAPLENAEWAKLHGPEDVAEFVESIRAEAASTLKLMTAFESKLFDSFITGANQAIAPFGFGKLAPIMRRSDFRFLQMKDEGRVMNVFIGFDPDHPETSKKYMGLIQWATTTELKRHPDKHSEVYFICDEASNYRFLNLQSHLTTARGDGIRTHLVFQDFDAFATTYSEATLATLLSESEIKHFLPGQRNPRTLKFLSDYLGSQSVMMPTLSVNPATGALQESWSESGRPLATQDEARRMKHAFLIVRDEAAALVEPVEYSECEPWRSQASINPFHGKPYLKPVKLRV